MYFIEIIGYTINTMKSLLFIGNMVFFSVSELMYYLFYRDYKNSISRIIKQLTNKNILYVKMFQAIALNKDLIDETINQEIIKYSDSVPYTEDDIDWNSFYKITEKYNLEEDNDMPIKSGMISIVFKLKKKESGEFLILKMKRKNINEKLNDGIERLKFIVGLFSYIPWFNTLEIPLLFNKNVIILKEQLDFNKEIKNTIEVRELCKNNCYIKIPFIIEEVTKIFPNVIMMEFIDGKHISELEAEDYYDFAKLVIKYGCISVSCHGIFHGDFHSGNILFIKNDKIDCSLPKYQIGIIDFGIVMKINECVKNNFLKIFTELFTGNHRENAILLIEVLLEPKNLLINLPNEDSENIIDIVEDILQNILKKSKSANQSLIFDFIINFNNYLNSQNLKKYGITINKDFIKIQMGVAMAHGISMILCKDNYIEVSNEVVNEIFHLDELTTLLDKKYD